MTEQNSIYKCPICGLICTVEQGAGGILVCCGKSMELLQENTTEAATEKHVPVIERTAQGIKVQVGSVVHPMEAEHYIEWLEVFVEEEQESGKKIKLKYQKFFQPGEEPVAEFPLTEARVTARAYCNLHGLWKA